MLKNAYLVAKIGADTAEDEQNFAEILPKIGNYPPGPLPSPPRRGRRLGRADALAAHPGHGLLRPRRGGGGRLCLF